jgi:histone acetyltransferase (RNA polymerase elongator complex component)
MPGLPGDSAETILYTAVRVVELRPDFVRIYPTVVVKDTPLEKMYLNTLYRPWSLNEMVKICRGMVSLFNAENIPIIRLGLQHTETLEQDIVAGPYHPSFGELVKGEQALKEELYYEKTFYHNAV